MLFQLSPHFKDDGSALDSLEGVLDTVSHQEFDYAVEFRHNSWLNASRKDIDPAAIEILRERDVANVPYRWPLDFTWAQGRQRITLIFGSMGGTMTYGTEMRRRTTTDWTVTTISTVETS